MSQSVRQTELFTSQDWTVLYEAFKQINFNASDPPSINRALRQYIQTNYAEDFNDWIASSEFVMILDMLSWLAGILAYKTDVSARENFIDTATAQESILRLARFLSYTPKRNRCASGLLRVTSVQTNDSVYDAYGNNLANVTINWNDANNSDWFEQMALVFNSVFVSTNPFGLPLTQGSYNSINTQLYRMNATYGANTANVGFSRTIDGTATNFELYNMAFDTANGFSEQTPNPASAFNCLYLSDGFGNTSANTGFFFGFKQGQTQSTVFSIATPVENQLLSVAVNNINQTDVWVQTVDSLGNDLQDWTAVPVLFSDNITYNSLPASERYIYQIVTEANDQIALRFSDGRFGNAPSGLIKAYYRTSNGLAYQIRPSDLGNPSVTISYTNRRGATKTLKLTFELTSPVTNSAPAETIDQVRRRAPLVYATQNRMVSGEDYNTFPLQSNLATKIKALSRTYSGESRFIDLNDPTSNYSETTVFAHDGMFYCENVPSYQELPLSNNLTATQLIANYIQPALQTNEMINWVRAVFLTAVKGGGVVIPALTWTLVSSTMMSSTGYFNIDSQYLRQGAMIQFVTPTYKTMWVGIASVTGSTNVAPNAGLVGPVTLASPVPNGSTVASIIPRYASTVTSTLIGSITSYINQTLSFDLWYDYAQQNETLHLFIQPKTYTATSSTQYKLLSFDCISGTLWRMTTVGLRYVFESNKAVRFFFDGDTAIDIKTGQEKQDLVKILDINLNITTSTALGRNYDLTIDKMITYPSGFQDPRRIAVTFTDSDDDGFPDDPDTFIQIINPSLSSTYLFWQLQSYGNYTPFFNVVVFATDQLRINAKTLGVGTVAFQIASNTLPYTFWVMTATGWVEDYRNYRYGVGRGMNVASKWILANGTTDTTVTPSELRFMWQHFVSGDRRIDPSRSNIIDIFVMATEYDTLVRQWIANGCIPTDEPTPPSDFDLQNMFSTYETFKMFSDDVVWRPVTYQYLFGQNANAPLRASFNVIKLINSTYSDGEIQASVLSAINAFFAADLWDFGETFYYTEMAAYIHQQLAGVIASCVIVPESSNGAFGDLFQVDCRADQIFISTAQLSDINIVQANTAANLRIS